MRSRSWSLANDIMSNNITGMKLHNRSQTDSQTDRQTDRQTHTHTSARARTHAHTHTHTHIHSCNAYCGKRKEGQFFVFHYLLKATTAHLFSMSSSALSATLCGYISCSGLNTRCYDRQECISSSGCGVWHCGKRKQDGKHTLTLCTAGQQPLGIHLHARQSRPKAPSFWKSHISA